MFHFQNLLLKKHLRPYSNVRLLFAGKHNSTGNTSSDLRTWLSAALANQDTCMDGFDGTNGIVKGLVSTGLGQVMSLLQQLLTQVQFFFFLLYQQMLPITNILCEWED